MTIKRRLQALGYPENDVHINDDQATRKLVVWLEQNKIKQSNNAALKNTNSANWQSAFDEYKKLLCCPLATCTTKEAELEWLLGKAIQIDFAQKKDIYNKHAVENLKKSIEPNVIAANPLDKLDFNSKDFEEGIKNLARILKVVDHPDPHLTLDACSKVINKRLHQHALNNPKEYVIKGTPFPYETTDLGFDLADASLQQAAKLLRLLYIQDLRYLQTHCNEVIVAVQSVTANPKTDTKLGKVGK